MNTLPITVGQKLTIKLLCLFQCIISKFDNKLSSLLQCPQQYYQKAPTTVAEREVESSKKKKVMKNLAQGQNFIAACKMNYTVPEVHILPSTVERIGIYKRKRWFQVGTEQKRWFLKRRSYSSYIRENYNIQTKV